LGSIVSDYVIKIETNIDLLHWGT